MAEPKKERKAKIRVLLFFLFMKIGLFTFGGGYAMIGLIRREFIDRRKWITPEEFTDMIAVSESTPGPLAINSATYVGYKIGGFLGALISTIGVVIPSFAIIYVISLFLQQFLELKLVAAAFKGIQVAVAFLILTAGLKLFKEMVKNRLTVAIAILVFAVMICLDVFSLSFSSIWMILIGAGIGLAFYLAARIKTCRQRKLLEPGGDTLAQGKTGGEEKEADVSQDKAEDSDPSAENSAGLSSVGKDGGTSETAEETKEEER